MKAKIKQVNRYEITIGDKTYSDFTKSGEWNGMVEFTSPQGKCIVSDNTTWLDGIFNLTDSTKDTEYDLVKASPSLLHGVK